LAPTARGLTWSLPCWAAQGDGLPAELIAQSATLRNARLLPVQIGSDDSPWHRTLIPELPQPAWRPPLLLYDARLRDRLCAPRIDLSVLYLCPIYASMPPAGRVHSLTSNQLVANRDDVSPVEISSAKPALPRLAGHRAAATRRNRHHPRSNLLIGSPRSTRQIMAMLDPGGVAQASRRGSSLKSRRSRR